MKNRIYISKFIYFFFFKKVFTNKPSVHVDFTIKLIEGIVIFENKKIEERMEKDMQDVHCKKGEKLNGGYMGHGREIFTT
jgi:hypothetical protein